MIPEKVREAFDVMCGADKPLVWISTCSDDVPHLVPVCFVKTLEDDKVIIGNVFIAKTESNIRKNSNIGVGVAFKDNGWNGYLLKGSAQVFSDGKVFGDFKNEVLEMSKGKRVLNSVIVVKIDEIYSLEPRIGGKQLV
jgi:predicted pyridoxine 5'-phosphate oxidase superfamily flavin-nucleotide-binding protein